MKRYMRRSNRIPMTILDRMSSIAERREPEAAEQPSEIVSALKIFFYKFCLTSLTKLHYFKTTNFQTLKIKSLNKNSINDLERVCKPSN